MGPSLVHPPTLTKKWNLLFKIRIRPSQELGLNGTVQGWVTWLRGCKEGWETGDRIIIIDLAWA